MAALTIRRLDPHVHSRLKALAGRRGTSMEEEARRILAAAVAESEAVDLAAAFHETFGPTHGVRLRLPRRDDMPRDVGLGG